PSPLEAEDPTLFPPLPVLPISCTNTLTLRAKSSSPPNWLVVPLTRSSAMEGELFIALYALLRQQAKLRKRRRRVIYSDELILLVFFWSVVHDRPRCWACQSQHWPPSMRWLALPSESTLCRRMRSVSVMLLLTMLYEHLKSLSPPTLVHRVDSK